MRPLIIIAVAIVGACDPKSERSGSSRPLAPAVLTYEGGDYGIPAAQLAHGQRMSKVLGCNSCHGANFKGGQFPSEPGWGAIHSANLTQLAEYSDDQLIRTIRTGVRPDGRELWLMPSQVYQHVSDADLLALISFLRTLAPDGEVHPAPVFLKGAKEEIANGGMKPPSKLVPDAKNRTPIDLGSSHAFGRYIAMTACSGCHGAELEGLEGFAPDLIVASAYSLPEFQVLLTEGKANGPRKLELMAESAQKHFANMTPRERAALYGYLKARAERPQ